MIKVLVFDRQQDLSINLDSAKEVASEVIKLEKNEADELALYFVDTEEISNLHQEFFQDPSPTDCISFPIDQDKSLGYQFLGEVFICPQMALDFVQKHEDPYIETTLYIVHGILHLLGYDDIEEKDEKIMREKEHQIMSHLVQAKKVLLVA